MSRILSLCCVVAPSAVKLSVAILMSLMLSVIWLNVVVPNVNICYRKKFWTVFASFSRQKYLFEVQRYETFTTCNLQTKLACFTFKNILFFTSQIFWSKAGDSMSTRPKVLYSHRLKKHKTWVGMFTAVVFSQKVNPIYLLNILQIETGAYIIIFLRVVILRWSLTVASILV